MLLLFVTKWWWDSEIYRNYSELCQEPLCVQFPSSTAMPVDPMSTFEDAEPDSADKRTSESRAPVVDEKD